MLPNLYKAKNDIPNLKAAWKIIYPTDLSSAPTWGINDFSGSFKVGYIIFSQS